jgi:hypothetical protein
VLRTMSLLASQMMALTRQVGRIRLQPQSIAARILPQATILQLQDYTGNLQLSGARSFATKKKKAAKATKQLAAAATAEVARVKDAEDPDKNRAALQNEEWVKFQQSIAVDGFETGQTMKVRTSNKKVRGGKARRKTQMTELEERIAERQRLTDVGGGEYPPLRYSDDETERLLAEAYAAIPERAGKRGSRNLKRQGVRWHLVRKIHKKHKYHMANHQTRKMVKRSLKVQQVKGVLEGAPAIRESDRAYQARVFQRWADNMVQGQGEDELVLEEANKVKATI